MGIAKITIINGRLAADAELKYSQEALAICSFRVAADSIRKKETKKDGTEGKKTYWIRCTLFGKQAETMAKYLSKGTAVYIDGNFDIEEWTSREGEARYTIECSVQTIQLLGSKPPVDGGDYDEQPQSKSDMKETAAQPQPQPSQPQAQPSQPQPSQPQTAASSEPPQDDIPF